MRRIVIVGGGYAGFYTAWKLEKLLRPTEAEVIVIDPLPYMTYQPFLPEVMAGSVEPRHALVSRRRQMLFHKNSIPLDGPLGSPFSASLRPIFRSRLARRKPTPK
jgi:NADH dehydrogenase FAD-containing subunit